MNDHFFNEFDLEKFSLLKERIHKRAFDFMIAKDGPAYNGFLPEDINILKDNTIEVILREYEAKETRVIFLIKSWIFVTNKYFYNVILKPIEEKRIRKEQNRLYEKRKEEKHTRDIVIKNIVNTWTDDELQGLYLQIKNKLHKRY